MKRVSESILLERITAKLFEHGVERAQAETIARVLIYADAAGISSHGTIRLPHYLQRLEQGGLNLYSDYTISPAKYPWAMLLDAAGGWGHVATEKAVGKSVELANQFGIAAINVQNSSHCGALSYYLRAIALEGYIGIVMANTDAIVVPTGGKKPFFGTNPLGFCFPTSNKKNPVIIDMATSAGAFGKIIIAQKQENTIPSEWAVDSQGMPTNNPNSAVSLLPMAGHKGYALAFLVETFTAILTGGAFGPDVVPMYTEIDQFRNLSLHILLMKSDIYLPEGQFEGHISEMIDRLKNVEVTLESKQVMIPGEPEWSCLQKSEKEGVPILESIYNFLAIGAE